MSKTSYVKMYYIEGNDHSHKNGTSDDVYAPIILFKSPCSKLMHMVGKNTWICSSTWNVVSFPIFDMDGAGSSDSIRRRPLLAIWDAGDDSAAGASGMQGRP
jgi:hypothetical protein